MDKDYKITEEEINQAVLRSPYSLADSPSRQGMTPAQIKRYFYDFIRVLSEKINIHLNDISTDLDTSNKKITNLEETDILIGSAISTKLSSHNNSASAHDDIRKRITQELINHNSGNAAHIDIRDDIKVVKDTANAAFAIASGRQRVYPISDIMELCDLLGENLKPGDIVLLLDSGECDFIVYESGLTDTQEMASNPNDINIEASELANGEIVFEEGKIYYFDGTRLLATKGNLETGLLAKSEDLEALKTQFLENIALVDDILSKINEELDTKEESLSKVESTEEMVLIESHSEYDLGLRTSVGLTLGEGDFDESIVNFRSGETATSFDAPSSLYFTGDDCLDGRLYPNKNRIYEINIKSVMGIYVARVGACDYEVIE